MSDDKDKKVVKWRENVWVKLYNSSRENVEGRSNEFLHFKWSNTCWMLLLLYSFQRLFFWEIDEERPQFLANLFVLFPTPFCPLKSTKKYANSLVKKSTYTLLPSSYTS